MSLQASIVPVPLTIFRLAPDRIIFLAVSDTVQHLTQYLHASDACDLLVLAFDGKNVGADKSEGDAVEDGQIVATVEG